MISKAQKECAKFFKSLHQQDKMFIIPNAWSVGSAYVYEKEGFQAVATSSAGIAYNLGYPDGEDISFDDLVYVVEKMTSRLHIPVSVDFERGYSEDPKQVKENAKRLLLAGAVGFNIEDGLPDQTLSPLDFQLEKIKTLVELKTELDIDFVINARTCAYWLNIEGDKLNIAIERGNAFKQVGADCIFIPGAIDEETVKLLVKSINAPINIILNGVFNDLDRLNSIGVRRLSVGSGPVRNVCERTINLAKDLYKGNVSEILNCNFTYKQANEYFANSKQI